MGNNRSWFLFNVVDSMLKGEIGGDPEILDDLIFDKLWIPEPQLPEFLHTEPKKKLVVSAPIAEVKVYPFALTYMGSSMNRLGYFLQPARGDDAAHCRNSRPLREKDYSNYFQRLGLGQKQRSGENFDRVEKSKSQGRAAV